MKLTIESTESGITFTAIISPSQAFEIIDLVIDDFEDDEEVALASVTDIADTSPRVDGFKVGDIVAMSTDDIPVSQVDCGPYSGRIVSITDG